ncbi:hypothetical protein OUZ56_008081 [Daphnia magna]|uniref:Uncharacterized protein n=1 Tax=Daphnia magna TaxID=35525 RepID=A0ABR0ABV7_9CRUS|nr:hypothetical protein OUZ56_008081 [Daphnia magna]
MRLKSYGFDFILCPVISRDEYRRESVVTPLLARTRSQSSCVCVEHHQSDNRKRGKLCEMLGKQRRSRGPVGSNASRSHGCGCRSAMNADGNWHANTNTTPRADLTDVVAREGSNLLCRGVNYVAAAALLFHFRCRNEDNDKTLRDDCLARYIHV